LRGHVGLVLIAEAELCGPSPNFDCVWAHVANLVPGEERNPSLRLAGAGTPTSRETNAGLDNIEGFRVFRRWHGLERNVVLYREKLAANGGILYDELFQLLRKRLGVGLVFQPEGAKFSPVAAPLALKEIAPLENLVGYSVRSRRVGPNPNDKIDMIGIDHCRDVLGGCIDVSAAIGHLDHQSEIKLFSFHATLHCGIGCRALSPARPSRKN
jgi:hypothetical protein